MAAAVPKGSIITYTSSDWYSGWFSSVSDVIRAVGQKLIADGLTIRNVKDTSLSTLGGIDKYLGGPAIFSVVLEVQVTGSSGYSKADDVALIVNHEVYQVTGKLPATWSVTDVTIPSAGVPGFLDWFREKLTGTKTTGEPSSKPKSNLFSGLGTTTVLYIGLAIFGFVAALALIGYSGALRRSTV
jgi:hypothetical protein